MNVFRRAEVWGLILLVLAGLVWVAADQWHRRSHNDDSTGDPASPIQDLRLTGTRISSHGSHRQLRVEFSARNQGAATFEIRPPGVRLLDAEGHEAPHFFAPGAFPPALPPGPTASSWCEFWLTASQASRPLTLEIHGRSLKVPVPETGG